MRLSRRRRASSTQTWPADRPVLFVTSFNDVLWEASGREFVGSFRRLNREFELWAYVEASRPGVEMEMARAVEDLGASVRRLESIPLLAQFREQAREVIPRSLGGDAQESMFPGDGPSSGDIWFRKHMFRWFRKIVALTDAVDDYDGVLFWIDCDCRAVRPLTRAVLAEAFAGAGVMHMRATRPHSETGVVGYDLAIPGVRRLIADMRSHYMSGDFVALPRWDDAVPLDLYLAQPSAPSSVDIARRVSGHGDVLEHTILGPYLEHDKGRHSRGLGLVR